MDSGPRFVTLGAATFKPPMSSTDETAAPLVAVYGSSMVTGEEAAFAEAREAGRLLARAGARVACGGYGGIMEAVSRGAAEAGGRVIGYTVATFRGRSPNLYLSEERSCRDLYERLAHLIDGADAMIAMGGGIGTLVEVFLAWNELYMGLLEPRPLILVGEPWKAAVDGLAETMEISPAHLAHVDFCQDAHAALALLEARGVLSGEPASS